MGDTVEEEFRRDLELAEEESAMTDVDVDTQAKIILSLFNDSQKKTPYGTSMIINEDQLPGGLEGSQQAIDRLNSEGYDIRYPKEQRDMSKEPGHPSMRGRYLQMVAIPEGKLWGKDSWAN